jgi:hypothetical protein
MTSPLYDRAFAAYRALCELEDELDRGTAANERERAELRMLLRRWTTDSRRKIERALLQVTA